jgi:uncharacterized protein YrrD
MIRGYSLCQKNIVVYLTRSILGFVEDVLIDPYSNRLAAFITSRHHQNDMIVVPWTGIKAVTPDRVVVWAPSMLVRARELFEIQHLLHQGIIKQGTRFRTLDGRLLGTMADFYIDERRGALVGYEVVGGELANGTQERRFLPAPDVITFDKQHDIAHIRPVRSSSPDGSQTRSHQLERTIDEFFNDLNESDARDPAVLAQPLLPEIAGCLAQHTVATQDGYIVVVEGQIITPSVIQYARQKHMEEALLAAVNFDLNRWLDKHKSTE